MENAAHDEAKAKALAFVNRQFGVKNGKEVVRALACWFHSEAAPRFLLDLYLEDGTNCFNHPEVILWCNARLRDAYGGWSTVRGNRKGSTKKVGNILLKGGTRLADEPRFQDWIARWIDSRER